MLDQCSSISGTAQGIGCWTLAHLTHSGFNVPQGLIRIAQLLRGAGHPRWPGSKIMWLEVTAAGSDAEPEQWSAHPSSGTSGPWAGGASGPWAPG